MLLIDMEHTYRQALFISTLCINYNRHVSSLLCQPGLSMSITNYVVLNFLRTINLYVLTVRDPRQIIFFREKL